MPWEIFMSIKTKVFGFVVLASAMAFAGPVSHFGRLVACGKNICGEKTGTSTPIQVKGPSLYWSTGSPSAMYSPIAVDWFVTNFNIGVIRVPMAIKYYKENQEPISVTDGNLDPVSSFGYLSKDAGTAGANKAAQKSLIKTIVDQAIVDDIYVIVDWHSHNAQNETSDAANFFKEMATEYKDVPNLIWEIYNEPVSASADQIDSYAQKVTAAIRGTGNKNLVIVGSHFYSSQPNNQAEKGLHNTYENIAYTLHFYAAANHGSYKSNLPSNAPTFITEWGATEASGDGNISNSSDWISWMNSNKLSGCMWFAGNSSEKSAMFPSSANPTNLDNYKSNFNGTSTTAGVFNSFMSSGWTTFVPSSHPFGKTIEYSLAEGKSATLSSELGIRGTITGVETAYGKATFTGNSITYQSPDFGSPERIDLIYKVKNGDVEIQEKILIKITNRKPIVKDTVLSISHKTVTKLTLLKLGVSNPGSGGTNALKLESAMASAGTVSISGDTLIYQPAGPGQAFVEYKVSNVNGTSAALLTLNCENQVPTIYASTNMTIENTAQAVLSMHRVRGKDADGDSIWFKAYTKGQFPGTLTLNATGDTLIYTPEPNRIGTVTVLAVITDGTYDSKIGTVTIKVTGSGASFDGTIPVPTDIEGYVAPEGIVVSESRKVKAADFSIKNSQVMMSLPQTSKISLEIFNTKGRKVGTVFSGTLSAGSHVLNMDRGNLPKGVYVIRARYGSQVKSVRFINR